MGRYRVLVWALWIRFLVSIGYPLYPEADSYTVGRNPVMEKIHNMDKQIWTEKDASC